MNKYWKVWNGYNGMDETDYKTLAEAQDGAKIYADCKAGRNNQKHPTLIMEVIGKVKVPVPAMEIEMFT